MISIIVAFDNNMLIGNNGKIPWHISEDFKHFKRTTIGCPCIMGRKTFNSIGNKPLPGRLNLVLSKESLGDVFCSSDIHELILVAKKQGKEIFIIGGAQVYKLVLDLGIVDRIIASRINSEYIGDTYFPKINENDWDVVEKEKYPEFDIVEYRKKC